MTLPVFDISPSPTQIAAIRRLDIEFAHRLLKKERGYPFVAGPSDVTGKWYTADENALICLHKLRTKVGNKAESRKSKAWLKNEGLLGLFEAPLEETH